MSSEQENRTASLYDSIAPRYDQLLGETPGNAWIRAAFRSLVVEIVPKGALLLDFGCGTGTDALWYVDQGFRVMAVDSSPGMMTQLRSKCAPRIETGEVIPVEITQAAFLSMELGERPAVIVSNFGVLSLIPDLPPLFAAFARYLEVGGFVMLSVLNPFFWRDVLQGWWWTGVLRSRAKGSIYFAGERGASYRHFVRRIDAVAGHNFIKTHQAGAGALIDLKNGRDEWSSPRTLCARLERKSWKVFPIKSLGQYIFLVYRRWV